MRKENGVTEVELVYHNKVKKADRPKVYGARDAYNLFYNSWDEGKLDLQEQFKIMLLNRNNDCMAVSTLSTGGIASCIVDIRLAFATAIKACATAIIIAHNHPSGNLKPSEEDKTLTQRFSMAAKLLDFQLLDHIIVTREGYLSFADEGLITEGFRSEIPLPF